MSCARSTVAVVIVTYNSARDIAECLRALDTGARDCVLGPVVVVDNASTDDTLSIARAARPGCELVATGVNGGYAGAVNIGVRHVFAAAGGAPDHVLVLNPDAVISPGCIDTLVAALQRTGRGIAVPRMTSSDGTLAHSLRHEPSLSRALGEALLGGPRAARLGWSEVIADARRYAQPGPVDWATGAALLVSADCLALVGEWDESYLLYSEETDYLLRARDAGFGAWFEPTAEVRHRGGEAGTSPMLWSLLMANRARQYATRHGRPAAIAYRWVLLAGEAARAAAGRPRSKAAARVLARPGRRISRLPA